MIYVYLRGRIGNQLFIYSFAKAVSKKKGDNDIVIDDTYVRKSGYVNSLLSYNLPNVRYVHNHLGWLSPKLIGFTPIYCLYRIFRRKYSYNQRYELEKKWQPFFNRHGGILCENGYMDYDIEGKKNIFIDGYYQSEKYFVNVAAEVKQELSLKDNPILETYPEIQRIKSRNTVCVSIKVQHNVGSSMYDVCNDGYWKNAIKYICDNVENPLFFICSDNVKYVKENLIDCSKYDTVFQSMDFPVEITLSVMAMCKHFIIGNTTFGWWAQYLADYEGKIVVAPSKWMRIDMPISIYQNNWHLVEV